MRKASYDEATRTAFTEAATNARAGGKSWGEAYMAAQDAGYRGTLAGIKQFLVKGPAKPGAEEPDAGHAHKLSDAPKVSEATAESAAPKAKRGRPKKSATAAPKAAKAVEASPTRRGGYDDATKSSILKAVTDARKEGDWKEALKAGQDAGYKGGLSGLMQFMTTQGGTVKAKKPGKRGRKPKATPVAAAPEPAKVVDSSVLEFIPESVRGDFAAMIRSKIEKEFGHSIQDRNLDRAMTVYLEIIQAQNAIGTKVAALKEL